MFNFTQEELDYINNGIEDENKAVYLSQMNKTWFVNILDGKYIIKFKNLDRAKTFIRNNMQGIWNAKLNGSTLVIFGADGGIWVQGFLCKEGKEEATEWVKKFRKQYILQRRRVIEDNNLNDTLK